jgi:hypothetical protein
MKVDGMMGNINFSRKYSGAEYSRLEFLILLPYETVDVTTGLKMDLLLKRSVIVLKFLC